jgi:hypothetical protein
VRFVEEGASPSEKHTRAAHHAKETTCKECLVRVVVVFRLAALRVKSGTP